MRADAVGVDNPRAANQDKKGKVHGKVGVDEAGEIEAGGGAGCQFVMLVMPVFRLPRVMGNLKILVVDYAKIARFHTPHD